MPNLQSKYGTESVSSLMILSDCRRHRDFIAAERETLSEVDRQFMTVSIKADETFEWV